MKLFASGIFLVSALALTPQIAQADTAPPAPAPMATPEMVGTLTANPAPMSFGAGFGPVYVTGAVTGLAQYQSNATHSFGGDGSSTVDLDNAWVSIQKTDGLVQFYIQAGEYSFPTLGVPYEKSSNTTSDTFGVIPVAYGKLQLSDTFSIEAGKLPTLIGVEYAFSPQNMNIERGLLWFQEPVFSRGVQLNYASGPLSVSLSWNDGSYSNVWNSFSGLISYAFDSANTLAFDTSITPGRTFTAGSEIYDLMYTYNAAPWAAGPYVQYQHFDAVKNGGFLFDSSSSDWGVGALASYAFNKYWSLAGRAEYEDSSGDGSALIYGPKSNAWSFTITPTWQKSIYYIRGEASYTTLGSQTVGFGKLLNKNDQVRLMLETGIIF
ncbi:MAG TPA: outer membrane beta-barrel protein [Rhizomicrobium sp.]